MSADAESDDMMFCASCGTAEVDDIKLKDCSACKLVKYCNVKCQRKHRPQHKKECKKRMAELRDELLFKQPESSHHGDCPICCLPLPIDNDKSTLMSCCCKLICDGCEYANTTRELVGNLQQKCPFCRHPAPNDDEEADKNFMKRAEFNDPVAILQIGLRRRDEGDIEGAFEYLTKAAELGDAGAHDVLALMYDEGKDVEKDEKKEVYHLEKAAIGGNPRARHNLGCHESERCRYERAVKHWIIAANLGHEGSMQNVKEAYRGGLVSKEDFDSALRVHQAAIDATKSPQRDEAEAFAAR